MAAAQDVLVEALLGAGDDAKYAAALRLVALSEHDDTKVGSIASLLELARCGRALPAQLAVVALERLALSEDGMKVRIAAAGGVEVLFELLRRPDCQITELAASALVCLGPNVDFMLEANNLFTLAIQIEYERNEWADVDPRVALAINAIAFELCEHLIQCNAELEAPIVEAEVRLLKLQTDAFNDYQRILSTEWEKDEAARSADWFSDSASESGSDSGSESQGFELTGSQTAAERTEANRIRAEQEGDVLDLATDDEASAPPKPDSDDDECAVVSTLGG